MKLNQKKKKKIIMNKPKNKQKNRLKNKPNNHNMKIMRIMQLKKFQRNMKLINNLK